jgi:hypothetical protein
MRKLLITALLIATATPALADQLVYDKQGNLQWPKYVCVDLRQNGRNAATYNDPSVSQADRQALLSTIIGLWQLHCQ